MADNIDITDETTFPPMEMFDEEVLNDQFDEYVEETTDEVRKYN